MAKKHTNKSIDLYDNKVKRSHTVFCAIIAFTVVVGLWYCLTEFTTFGEMFPSPVAVVVALVEATYTPIGGLLLWEHVLWTLSRIAVGFLIGAVVGNIAGLAMGNSRAINAAIRPIFEILRPIPGIAWIPLAILWFGIDESSKYFIIFISTFVICTLNAYDGAIRTSPHLVGAAKMLGAKENQVFWKVVLPSSLPQIFAGLQIAISTACSTVLAAEMIRSSEGAGWFIIRGMETGDMTRILVGIISISIMGLVLVSLLRAIEGRALRWNKRT